MDTCDSVIIGGGLSGQLAAWLLSQKGRTVILCEKEKTLGGLYRVDTHHGLTIDFGFHFNCISPHQAREFGLNLPWIEYRQKAPLFFHQKEWQPISIHSLTPEQRIFCMSDFVLPQGGMKIVFESLQNSKNLKIIPSSPILECSVESSFIREVRSNGQAWRAEAFVMALPSSVMIKLAGEGNFHRGFLRRSKQQPHATAVKLDFILKERISDLSHVLFDVENNGVGFFPSNSDPSFGPSTRQILQWLFFLGEENISNKEEITKKIRAGKRFLRKAFPNIEEKILWERISVIPALCLTDAWQDACDKEWTSLKNLFWTGDVYEGGIASAVIKTVDRIESYLASGEKNKNI